MDENVGNGAGDADFSSRFRVDGYCGARAEHVAEFLNFVAIDVEHEECCGNVAALLGRTKRYGFYVAFRFLCGIEEEF